MNNFNYQYKDKRWYKIIYNRLEWSIIPDSKYNLNPVFVMKSSVANIKISSGLFVIIGWGKEFPVSAVTPEGLLVGPKWIFDVSFVFVAAS